MQFPASVYLAGPISGLNYEGATTWREDVRVILEEAGIKAWSPMRAKEYLQGENEFTKACTEYARFGCLSSPRGIMARDHFDATRVDAVFVNLLGAKTVSIGTVMEIAWAYHVRAKVIVIIEPDGSNVHEHAMVNEAIDFRCATVEEAIKVTRAILEI